MYPELSVGLDFLVSHLYNKLPRRRIDVFAEELGKALKKKFQDHWYPDEPFKGSGYRSIRIVEGKLDPAFRLASQLSGLSLEEILEHLPKGLTIWIDPDEVSYRIGETGQVTILYFNKRSTGGSAPSCLEPLSLTPSGYPAYQSDGMSNVEQLNYLFNCFGSRTETNFNNRDSADSVAVGFEKMKLDVGGGCGGGGGGCGGGGRTPYANSLPFQNALQVNPNNNNNNNNQQQQQQQLLLGLSNKSKNSSCFTAAAFAQTKFGSTKMKNHSTGHQSRPTRLMAATTAELHSRLNLAAQVNALGARSPGSFLPYLGFPPGHHGSWPLERQTSAPSSCLNSPSTGFVPLAANHNLLSHLMQPSAGISRQSPNDSPASSSSTSSIHSPGGRPLIDQSLLKQQHDQQQMHQFTGKSKGHQQHHHHHLQLQSQMSSGSDGQNSSPSASSTDSEKSLASAADLDWNNYISSYPNIHHLLVAN